MQSSGLPAREAVLGKAGGRTPHAGASPLLAGPSHEKTRRDRQSRTGLLLLLYSVIKGFGVSRSGNSSSLSVATKNPDPHMILV